MPRWTLVLFLFNAAFFAINGLAAWKIYWHQPPQPTLLDALLRRPPEPQIVEYKDFISIMLTGLSAMIAVLGIGLATVAIWGYQRLNEDAKMVGERAATKAAVQKLAERGQERLSVEEASARFRNLPGLSPDTVQALVDVYSKGSESASSAPAERDGNGHATNR